MFNPIAYADNFYEQHVSAVPRTYRTSGNIFLIYGAFVFASVFPFGLIMSYSNFGVHFWSSFVRAGSITGISVFAGFLMHYEARKSLYDAADIEDAHRRAGKSLLVLNFVMFSSIAIPLINRLFPFPPFSYLYALMSDGTAGKLNLILTVRHIESWPALLRIAGTLALLLGSVLYFLFCLTSLIFAIRLLIDGYRTVKPNESRGLVSWLLVRYRDMLQKIVGRSIDTKANIYKASGYFYLGMVAVMACPVIIYQFTMLAVLGNNTLLAEIWLTSGRRMSGTTVLITVTTVAFYLISIFLPLVGAWRAFRKSKTTDSTNSSIEPLSTESKWLRRSSVAILLLAFFFTGSAGPSYLSNRRNSSLRPTPILLFTQISQTQRSPNATSSLRQGSYSTKRSEITVFLWLQCYPMIGMAVLTWSASGLMRRKNLENEADNPESISLKATLEPEHYNMDIDYVISMASSQNYWRRKFIVLFLLSCFIGPVFLVLRRTWHTVEPALTDQIISDVSIYRSKELKDSLTKESLLKCVHLLKSRGVIQSALENKMIANLPVIVEQKNPIDWIRQYLSAEELGDIGLELRITLNVPKGCVDQGIVLLDGIITAFIAEVQEAIPGSVAIQSTSSRSRFGGTY